MFILVSYLRMSNRLDASILESAVGDPLPGGVDNVITGEETDVKGKTGPQARHGPGGP